MSIHSVILDTYYLDLLLNNVRIYFMKGFVLHMNYRHNEDKRAFYNFRFHILKPPSRMFEHSESVNGVIIVLSLLVYV